MPTAKQKMYQVTKTASPNEASQTARIDLELTQLAAAGDHRARRQLVDRLYDRVRTTVYFLARGHQNEEDFVQASIVEILLSVGGFRAQSSLEAWADRIAVRTTMRKLKSMRKWGQVVPLETVPLPSSTAIAEDRVYARQINARIAVHLQKLKPKHTEALTLHLVLGYTVPEVAEITNTKLETMRDRLKVARKKFRKMIERDSTLVEWAGKGVA